MDPTVPRQRARNNGPGVQFRSATSRFLSNAQHNSAYEHPDIARELKKLIGHSIRRPGDSPLESPAEVPSSLKSKRLLSPQAISQEAVPLKKMKSYTCVAETSSLIVNMENGEIDPRKRQSFINAGGADDVMTLEFPIKMINGKTSSNLKIDNTRIEKVSTGKVNRNKLSKGKSEGLLDLNDELYLNETQNSSCKSSSSGMRGKRAKRSSFQDESFEYGNRRDSITPGASHGRIKEEYAGAEKKGASKSNLKLNTKQQNEAQYCKQVTMFWSDSGKSMAALKDSDMKFLLEQTRTIKTGWANLIEVT
jgi:hypothetical protein